MLLAQPNIEYTFDYAPQKEFLEENYSQKYSNEVNMNKAITIQVNGVNLLAFKNDVENVENDISTFEKENNISLIDNDIVAQEKSIIKENILSDIKKLGNLPINWDGYGAIKVKPNSLSNALNIISNKAIDYDGIEDITAYPNGTIYVLWRSTQNRKLGLEIGESEMSYYADTADETLFFTNVEITNENIQILAQNIWQL